MKQRNIYPFTARQLRFLEAIQSKLVQITDPDPEFITHETFEFKIKQTKQFGPLPAIVFKPHSNQIKAEIVRKAGLIDKDREAALQKIREKYGIHAQRHREARLFNAEWDNLMLKVKKAVYASAWINKLFSTEKQVVSAPIKILQQIVMQEYVKEIGQTFSPIHDGGVDRSINEVRCVESYKDELMDLD